MTDTILWRRLDLPGHEIGRLARRGEEWQLSGTAVFAYDHRPCKLEYLVTCDGRWRTRSAWVRGTVGGEDVDLDVSVDTEQRWWLRGVEHPEVAGCVDVDLGFSPSTNLLPIRRLSLGIGEAAEVRAAWLPFPSLTFEVLPQVYRREAAATYRYESHGGAFARVLEVNAAGFVTRYPDLWEAEGNL